MPDYYCEYCDPYPCNCAPRWDGLPGNKDSAAYEDMLAEAHAWFFDGLKFPQCYMRTEKPSTVIWGELKLTDDIPF